MWNENSRDSAVGPGEAVSFPYRTCRIDSMSLPTTLGRGRLESVAPAIAERNLKIF